MMQQYAWITLLIIVGLPIAGCALTSCLIYTQLSYPVHAVWTESNVDMRPRFPEFHFSDLENLGFRLAAYLLKSEGEELLYLALFIYPQNKDSAEVFVSTKGSTSFALPIFKSRFEDGFAFEVGSTAAAPHEILGGPAFPAFNFPQARSTAELYRIHRLLKSHFSKSHVPVVADGGGEAREFARKAEEVHQYAMSRPDYRLSPDGSLYTYTVRGAMRAAWRHQWPISQVSRWCTLYSAKQHVKRLEASR